MERWSAMQEVQSSLSGHRSRLSYLRAILEEAKSEIRGTGYLSEGIRKQIFHAFCFWDYLFARVFLSARPGEQIDRGSSSGPKEKYSVKVFDTVALIALIDDRLKRLSSFDEYALEHERLAGDA